MLLRLQVSGFKNLVDVDVRFGSFTCIAGNNGVGKSNLIDVIQFLSALADQPFLEAITAIRGEGLASSTPESIFFHAGTVKSDTIALVADLLIPAEGRDPFGNALMAKATLLRYSLTLRLQSPYEITIDAEELRSLTPEEGHAALVAYPVLTHIAKQQPTVPLTFLTTNAEGIVQLLLEDSYTVRRLSPREMLKRTLLTQAEPLLFPTAYLAREELRSWRAFHLEPTALRTPDKITESETRLASNGRYMAATLNALIEGAGDGEAQSDLMQDIAALLAQLIGDVRGVGIDRDPLHNAIALYVEDRHGSRHNVQALSDGTLRFLAMAILAHDPRPGVSCIEEPENGLHPERIAIMLELLQSTAFDPAYAIDATNPLHQVIITTHSPIVVSQAPDASLLYAQLLRRRRQKKLVNVATFRWLKGTWRANLTPDTTMTVARGSIFSYVAPITATNIVDAQTSVLQNADIQAMLHHTMTESAKE